MNEHAHVRRDDFCVFEARLNHRKYLLVPHKPRDIVPEVLVVVSDNVSRRIIFANELIEAQVVATRAIVLIPSASDPLGALPNYLREMTCSLREPRVVEVVFRDLSVPGIVDACFCLCEVVDVS
jgi:hypothetical protein